MFHSSASTLQCEYSPKRIELLINELHENGDSVAHFLVECA